MTTSHTKLAQLIDEDTRDEITTRICDGAGRTPEDCNEQARNELDEYCKTHDC
jgi:hypothetical protein